MHVVKRLLFAEQHAWPAVADHCIKINTCQRQLLLLLSAVACRQVAGGALFVRGSGLEPACVRFTLVAVLWV